MIAIPIPDTVPVLKTVSIVYIHVQMALRGCYDLPVPWQIRCYSIDCWKLQLRRHQSSAPHVLCEEKTHVAGEVSSQMVSSAVNVFMICSVCSNTNGHGRVVTGNLVLYHPIRSNKGSWRRKYKTLVYGPEQGCCELLCPSTTPST